MALAPHQVAQICPLSTGTGARLGSPLPSGLPCVLLFRVGLFPVALCLPTLPHPSLLLQFLSFRPVPLPLATVPRPTPLR